MPFLVLWLERKAFSWGFFFFFWYVPMGVLSFEFFQLLFRINEAKSKCRVSLSCPPSGLGSLARLPYSLHLSQFFRLVLYILPRMFSCT